MSIEAASANDEHASAEKNDPDSIDAGLENLRIDDRDCNNEPGPSPAPAVGAGAPGAAPGSSSPQPQCEAGQKDEASECDLYHVKWITLLDKAKCPIITQNRNGPCPMVAIFNVLLLRGQVVLNENVDILTTERLLSHISDCILRLSTYNRDSGGAGSGAPPDNSANLEQIVSDAMSLLPKLTTGLDVNVRFTIVSDFEYTSDLAIFDLLNIPVYHGWLVDPQQADLAAALGSRGYNELVERMLAGKFSDDSAVVSEAILAEQFLESTASQLTYHGLAELQERMRQSELAVLFRNNHFSTLHKVKEELFVLVTDQGFLSESDVVWETLHSIDGDSHFVDAEFRTVPPKTAAGQPAAAGVVAGSESQIQDDFAVALALDSDVPLASDQTLPAPNTSNDHELAARLQMEEDAAAAVAQPPRSPVAAQQADSQPARRRSSAERRDNDKCTLL